MPVDPQIQALLDQGTGVPATHTLTLDLARAQYEARIALMAPGADIASAREQTIDGPGGPLRIRIHTLRGTGPFPLLVFFHGRRRREWDSNRQFLSRQSRSVCGLW